LRQLSSDGQSNLPVNQLQLDLNSNDDDDDNNDDDDDDDDNRIGVVECR